jgi:hypothetical protein
MGTRQTTSTEGKRVSFKIDDTYYIPGRDKSLVFADRFKNAKFCVCYTNVYRDMGHHFENRWGSPAWVAYDNGTFGGQNFNYFNDRNEAVEDFNNRQKLTPKCFKSTFAYADVFFVENDSINN